MRLAGIFVTAFVLAVPALGLPASGAETGPQGPAHGPLRRQDWLLPSPAPGVMMRAIVYRPPGAGPFRLAVLAHASTQNAAQRWRMAVPAFAPLAAWLVARDFAVVVPLRPGHGATGGPYLEDQGGCDDADYGRSGRATADSLQAAIDALARAPFVRRDGMVVIGHSAGGWGALALAARAPGGVTAIVNFAGGRGGRSYGRVGNNCAPERLIAAAGDFGAAARAPTLWIYADNDGFFGPRLARRMFDAWRGSGGRGELVQLPPFGDDGHTLVETEAGVAVWGPVVARFLGVKP